MENEGTFYYILKLYRYYLFINKDKCINSWQRAHKIELDDKLLHAGWMEYEPLVRNIL